MTDGISRRRDDLDDYLPNDDELADDVLNLETQRRLWLRAIIPLLHNRSHESDPSGRVQLAFDLMHIAACERVSRIMQSDLPDHQA